MMMRICGIISALISIVVATVLWLGFDSLSDARPELGDIELFEDANCIESCWQNLHLGESTVNELERFVEETDYFEVEASILDTIHEGFVLYTFSYPGSSISFLVENDILVSIGFFGVSGVSLKEIVDKLGEPPYFDSDYGYDYRKDQLVGWIELYYPEKGYYFNIAAPASRLSSAEINVCFSEQSSVDHIEIFPPNTIETMLTLGPAYHFKNLAESDVEEYLARLDTWTGYGCTVIPSR
ncbi:MAG: hypothetical protein L0154_03230 [Chloroflexi bacterium]|nr:hypothetical protein [Chloroflexota bacterium]